MSYHINGRNKVKYGSVRFNCIAAIVLYLFNLMTYEYNLFEKETPYNFNNVNIRFI